MNENKTASRLARIGSRAISLDKAALPVEPPIRSRHAAITKELSTYQRYKDWTRTMNDAWDERTDRK